MTDHRIVVSLTTMPSRIEGLRKVIPSLLNQTRKPDEIALNIPAKCSRMDSEYDIPDWLNESVTVHRVDRDYGPATKLLPTLMREQDPETRIITVDDDIIYSKEVVEVLAGANTEDRVVGIMGTITRLTRKDLYVHSEVMRDKECVVDLLGGYRGVCYRRGLIEDDIYADFDAVCELLGELILDDDSFFTRYLTAKGIRRYVVKGIPRSKEGVYGRLNFEEVEVPEGTGIFKDAGGDTNRQLDASEYAMFRHFFPDEYERDRDSIEYHVSGDNLFHGRGCRADKRAALECWLTGTQKGNRQCLRNVVYAFEMGIGVNEPVIENPFGDIESIASDISQMKYVDLCTFMLSLSNHLDNYKCRDVNAVKRHLARVLKG